MANRLLINGQTNTGIKYSSSVPAGTSNSGSGGNAWHTWSVLRSIGGVLTVVDTGVVGSAGSHGWLFALDADGLTFDITVPAAQVQVLNVWVSLEDATGVYTSSTETLDSSGPAPTTSPSVTVSQVSASSYYNPPGTPSSGQVQMHVTLGSVANGTQWELDTAPASTGPWTADPNTVLVNTGVDSLNVSGSTATWVRARSINNYGGANLAGPYSAAVQFSPTLPGLPSAPTGLTATAGNAQVTLAWTVDANDTLGYDVRRSADGGTTWSTIATGVQQASYIDSGVTNGTTYEYEVRGENAAGAGTWCSAVSATPTAPATPSPLPLSMVRPLGGETFQAGQSVAIQWAWGSPTAGYAMTPVTITFSALGDFSDSVTLASNVPTTTQQYAWVAPQTATTTAKIKVTASGTPATSATSGAFTISTTSLASQSVHITNPATGNSLTAGTTVSITWTRGGEAGATATPCDVYYSTDGFVTLSSIASNLAGTVLSTNWTVPNSNTTTGQIRVVAHGSPQQIDTTGDFSITGAGGGGGAITASISSPANAAVVSGTVLVRAKVDGGTGGVNRVELYVNNSLVSTVNAITGSPDFYDLPWNTSPTANGAYTAYVIAYDNATPTANSAQSASITLNVDNAVVGANEYVFLNPWTPNAGNKIKRALVTCNVGPVTDVRLTRLIQAGIRFGSTASSTWSDYTVVPLNRQQDFTPSSDTAQVAFLLAKTSTVTPWTFTEQIVKMVGGAGSGNNEILILTSDNKLWLFSGSVAPTLLLDASTIMLSGETINDIAWWQGRVYLALSGGAAPLSSRLYDYDPTSGDESYTIGTVFSANANALAATSNALYIGTQSGKVHMLATNGQMKVVAGTPTVLPAAVKALFPLALDKTNTTPGVAAALADGSLWDLQSSNATYGASEIYSAANGTTQITSAALQADPGATNKTRYIAATGVGNIYTSEPNATNYGLAYTASFNIAAIAGFAGTVYFGGSDSRLWGRTFNVSANSLQWGAATDPLTNVTAIKSVVALGSSLFIGCTGTGNTLWQFQAPNISSNAVIGQTISDIAAVAVAYA